MTGPSPPGGTAPPTSGARSSAAYPATRRTTKSRRLDMLGRSLPVPLGAEPRQALRDYLSAARTVSARVLAAKAVVLVVPADRAGELVWPVT